jgi:hypothetical protein
MPQYSQIIFLEGQETQQRPCSGETTAPHRDSNRVPPEQESEILVTTPRSSVVFKGTTYRLMVYTVAVHVHYIAKVLS